MIGPPNVGYRAKRLPDGKPTSRGLPPAVPEVDPEAADHVRRAFRRVKNGMSITRAWKLWLAEGGPYDSRSKEGRMSLEAFRRMLANERYRGLWRHGEFRSVWSSKKDYVLRVPRAADEVLVRIDESLRIVDDATFFAVGARLAANKKRRAGGDSHATAGGAPTATRSKKEKGKATAATDRKEPHLWDLVGDCFHCPTCDVRLYVSGSNAVGFRCKNRLCPNRLALRRETAVRAVCEELCRLISRDGELIADVVAAAMRLDAAGEESVSAELARVRRRISPVTGAIDTLLELAGEGTAEDRESRKVKIRAVEQERSVLREQEARLRTLLGAGATSITPDRVRRLLAEAATLLGQGAEGRLGVEEVFVDAEAFRRLVGGRIEVRVECLPGRKRHAVRGVFRPGLLRATREVLGLPTVVGASDPEPIGEVKVWLRRPWKHDLLADRVGELIETNGLTYREAAERLRAEGVAVSKLAVGRIFARFRQLRELRSCAGKSESGDANRAEGTVEGQEDLPPLAEAG